MARHLADLDCQVPPGSRAAGVAISRARWHDKAIVLVPPYPGLTMGNKRGPSAKTRPRIGAPKVAWHCGRGQLSQPTAGSVIWRVMSLTVQHLSGVTLWARGSGLEIVLLVTGTILLTRMATWFGARITRRIDVTPRKRTR